VDEYPDMINIPAMKKHVDRLKPDRPYENTVTNKSLVAASRMTLDRLKAEKKIKYF
jgi:hypothetical protein